MVLNNEEKAALMIMWMKKELLVVGRSDGKGSRGLPRSRPKLDWTHLSSTLHALHTKAIADTDDRDSACIRHQSIAHSVQTPLSLLINCTYTSCPGAHHS
jgi:hypothetical protein